MKFSLIFSLAVPDFYDTDANYLKKQSTAIKLFVGN